MVYHAGYVGNRTLGGYVSSPVRNYSGLESNIQNSEVLTRNVNEGIEVMLNDTVGGVLYCTNDNYSGLYLDNKRSVMYHGSLDDFLNPQRSRARFVGEIDSEVQQIIEEGFVAVTGQQFPNDVVVHVCDQKQLAAAHGSWQEGVVGFAVNRKDAGQISDIFVQQGELDSLLLTLGHELGHVMTKRLDNVVNEEAKAFAFSLAWVQAIIKHNIGGLGESFIVDQKPAKNGLHDVAFNFVVKQLATGKDAIKVFDDVVNGSVVVGV
jgi:hypothetical protein